MVWNGTMEWYRKKLEGMLSIWDVETIGLDGCWDAGEKLKEASKK